MARDLLDQILDEMRAEGLNPKLRKPDPERNKRRTIEMANAKTKLALAVGQFLKEQNETNLANLRKEYSYYVNKYPSAKFSEGA